MIGSGDHDGTSIYGTQVPPCQALFAYGCAGEFVESWGDFECGVCDYGYAWVLGLLSR